jgi:hypothetical protein
LPLTETKQGLDGPQQNVHGERDQRGVVKGALLGAAAGGTLGALG